MINLISIKNNDFSNRLVYKVDISPRVNDYIVNLEDLSPIIRKKFLAAIYDKYTFSRDLHSNNIFFKDYNKLVKQKFEDLSIVFTYENKPIDIDSDVILVTERIKGKTHVLYTKKVLFR